MNKCAGRLLRDIIIVVSLSLGASVVVFTYQVWDSSSNSYDQSLWLQSTEQQLKNQNEEYYNNLYERYSRIHRDLNDYQYQSDRRITLLEERIKSLEEFIKSQQGLVINNSNIQTN